MFVGNLRTHIPPHENLVEVDSGAGLLLAEAFVVASFSEGSPSYSRLDLLLFALEPPTDCRETLDSRVNRDAKEAAGAITLLAKLFALVDESDTTLVEQACCSGCLWDCCSNAEE